MVCSDGLASINQPTNQQITKTPKSKAKVSKREVLCCALSYPAVPCHVRCAKHMPTRACPGWWQPTR